MQLQWEPAIADPDRSAPLSKPAHHYTAHQHTVCVQPLLAKLMLTGRCEVIIAFCDSASKSRHPTDAGIPDARRSTSQMFKALRKNSFCRRRSQTKHTLQQYTAHQAGAGRSTRSE